MNIRNLYGSHSCKTSELYDDVCYSLTTSSSCLIIKWLTLLQIVIMTFRQWNGCLVLLQKSHFLSFVVVFHLFCNAIPRKIITDRETDAVATGENSSNKMGNIFIIVGCIPAKLISYIACYRLTHTRIRQREIFRLEKKISRNRTAPMHHAPVSWCYAVVCSFVFPLPETVQKKWGEGVCRSVRLTGGRYPKRKSSNFDRSWSNEDAFPTSDKFWIIFGNAEEPSHFSYSINPNQSKRCPPQLVASRQSRHEATDQISEQSALVSRWVCSWQFEFRFKTKSKTFFFRPLTPDRIDSPDPSADALPERQDYGKLYQNGKEK